MLIIADIKKYDFSTKKEDYIEKNYLIDNLECLAEKGFIFRGQSKESYLLIPKAFRPPFIKKMDEAYGRVSNYSDWPKSEKYKKLIQLYWKTPDAVTRLEVIRTCELTLYILKYNYGLATHVGQYPEKFNRETNEMYKLRPPLFWTTEETFMSLLQYLLHNSIGIISLDGKVLKYSEINEELAAYDESLPQHYDTPTASLDWSSDPYTAMYFALENSSYGFVSIYVYKEISNSEKNPIEIVSGNKDCKNERIVRQKGLFTRLRYACAYYFFYGKWPSFECFTKKMLKNFELMKFDIPVEYKNEFQELLTQRGLTKEFLLPN